MTDPDKIILGIDPGTNVLGYGLIGLKGGPHANGTKGIVCGRTKVEMLAMGVIDLQRCKDVYLKLGRIYERVMGVIDAFKPDELSIEAPFFGKNVQSMLKLGRAQGVVIAAAISRDIPIHEYSPSEIKQAITGNGMADKEQVKRMMQQLLAIAPDRMLPYLDATDALAAAYCHYLQERGPLAALTAAGRGTKLVAPTTERGTKSWADFAKTHADRISRIAR